MTCMSGSPDVGPCCRTSQLTAPKKRPSVVRDNGIGESWRRVVGKLQDVYQPLLTIAAHGLEAHGLGFRV